MSSIIRSPVLSEKKRKLTSRNSPNDHGGEIGGRSVATAQKDDIVSSRYLSEVEIKELIDRAKQSVSTQFKDEAETAGELARQRGLREGQLAGAEEARKTFSYELERLQSIALGLERALKSGNFDAEDMAVAIAFEAVCKVLGAEALTAEGIQAIVRETTARVRASETIVVRLHGADLEMLANAGMLANAWPVGTKISWMEDKHVELGGCMIETSTGELDARLETQLDILRTTLLEARQKSRK